MKMLGPQKTDNAINILSKINLNTFLLLGYFHGKG